jgi:hypothetical protein
MKWIKTIHGSYINSDKFFWIGIVKENECFSIVIRDDCQNEFIIDSFKDKEECEEELEHIFKSWLD